MGSTTYEWMLEHAVSVKDQMGTAWPYAQPTWVFSSRQLPRVKGASLSFASGDVRAVHREMQAAAKGKNLWVVGGGDLAGQFFDAGLLDEIIVQVGSVTLGKGKPLFPRRVTGRSLRLASVRQVGTGFAELRYEIGRDQRPRSA